jgi:hypothetical protein
MENRELHALADRVIEELITNCDSEDEANELLSEELDGAVPVYYAEQIKLLVDTDVGHIDVSEYVSGAKEITVMNLLPIAIYQGIQEIVQERISEKLGTPAEE